MRPGLLCPGRPWSAFPTPWKTRFNEAGAVMPRKLMGCILAYLCRPCFNEAGAVMPRKIPSRACSIPTARSFNEAGAVMPRKGAVSPAHAATM